MALVHHASFFLAHHAQNIDEEHANNESIAGVLALDKDVRRPIRLLFHG